MKKLLLATLVVLALGIYTHASAQLFTENVEYGTGNLVDSAGGNWINISGTLPIQITAGSLSYTSYPASGIGNQITINAYKSSAQDAYRQFTTQVPDGNVYASFLVKIKSDSMSPDTSTMGDYFIDLMPSTSTTTLVGRVQTKRGSAAGKFKFGLKTTTANTTVWATPEYDVNATYLIVLNYNLVTGATNDVAKLWINPVVPDVEPAADLSQTSIGTDPADIARIAIRQGYTAASRLLTPEADIDGIQVGTTWGSVTGVAGQPNDQSLPLAFALKASPNPASQRSQISFNLPNAANVDLSIFNIAGQKVATLAKGPMSAGAHNVDWQTNQVSNGVYFYQLQSGNRLVSQKILVIR